MQGNLNDNTKIVQMIDAEDIAAGTNNSTGQDTKEFREALFIVNAKNNSAGAATIQLNIQESDLVGGTFVLIAGATHTAVSIATTVATQIIGRVNLDELVDGNAFVRAQVITATNNVTYGVQMILSSGYYKPVVNADEQFDVG